MRCLPPIATLALSSASLVLAHDGVHLPPFFDAPPLSGSFPAPLDLEFAADGSMLVACKDGRVYFHDGLIKQSAPVIDLRDEVNNDGDRGLLGMALQPGFSPDGGANSWVYLLYCVSPVPGQDWGYAQNDQASFCRLTRYSVELVAGLVLADLSSRQVLLGEQDESGLVPHALASVHNSHSTGTLQFGSDGSLMLSIGDAAHWDFHDFGGHDASAFETYTHPVTGLVGPHPIEYDSGSFRAQDLRALAGKLLRIDPATGLGYASNPFFDGDPDSAASRVWALGLRNPYRFTRVPGTGSLDPALGNPGSFLVGEVGNIQFEELLRCEGGENFQWPCAEGPDPFAEFQDHSHGANPLGFPDCQNMGPGSPTSALFAYNHYETSATTPSGLHVDQDGSALANLIGRCVIGGAYYPGGDYPELWDGRYFFADYVEGWIESAAFDASGNLVEVRRFAEEVGALTDMEAHPLTGDLYYLDNEDSSLGQVRRIGYGFDKPPLAVIEASPTAGFPPLFVQFDGTKSEEPEGQPMSFLWDFGDGTPTSSSVTPGHTYTQKGIFGVTLTVTDSSNQPNTTTLDITVGNTPPVVTILTPTPGTTFSGATLLQLTGVGSDLQDPTLQLVWQIDLYHDSHIHPQSANLIGDSVSYQLDPHGDQGELVYYRVLLSATDSAGLVGTDHVFLYPEEGYRDLSGTALPIARVFELSPPGPTGAGNHDIEVMRDTVFPVQGAPASTLQFDSFHGGDQGDLDWIGYELPAAPGVEFRFVRLDFQEGMHFPGGGWWESFQVEVRQGQSWVPASGLVATPAYPFEFAQTPGFDGVTFDAYRLDFDPIAGDAIRLAGDPGGAASFISVSELRAFAVDLPPPAATQRDISDEANIMAKVYTLVPSGPQGDGNTNRELLRDGTLPPIGSLSYWASFDTFHDGDQGNEDWLAYLYDEAHTFERVVYQEGRHTGQGGWFDDLGLEVLASDGSTWTPVPGVGISPPLPADTSPAGGFESFELSFPPVTGHGLRLIGAPGGPADYISVAEFVVYEPLLADGCGWESFGSGLGGANELTLGSTTPAALGYPIVLEVSGAVNAVPGFLGFALSEVSLPLLNGTLLLDPGTLSLLQLTFDANGEAELAASLPNTPALHGGSLPLQAFALAPELPGSVRFSNGLRVVGCAP